MLFIGMSTSPRAHSVCNSRHVVASKAPGLASVARQHADDSGRNGLGTARFYGHLLVGTSKE